MKVLIIRNAWRHQDYGGAEEFAISLVRALSLEGHDVKLITGTGALLEKVRSLSVRHIEGPFSSRQILTKHRAPFIGKYLFDLSKARKEYIRIFKEEKPDLIHCNGQQESIAATAAAAYLKIPVLWSDHGELKNSLNFSFMPPWGIPGILLKQQIKKISSLLMINDEDIQFVRTLFPDLSIKVVPNGVDDLYDKTSQRTDQLVFASRIIREKGIFELIVAVRNLKRSGLSLKLIIAGDGPSRKLIAREVAENLANNAILTNYSDKVIQSAAIFVLPTYTEAQSLAILKAMMYKTPIITTNIRGNTHFLKNGRNAILVEPKNSGVLAEAIRRLSSDPKLQKKIAEAARRDYEEKFDLNMIIKKYYLPIYAEAQYDKRKQ